MNSESQFFKCYRGVVRTEGKIIGLAMDNMIKTESNWSVIRGDKKALAVVGPLWKTFTHLPPALSLLVTATSERVQMQDGCFSFTFTRRQRLAALQGRRLNMGRRRVRVIAADQAAHRPLMTLSEQIRLWVINLDMESMLAAGFIRVSLTPEAWCSLL